MKYLFIYSKYLSQVEFYHTLLSRTLNDVQNGVRTSRTSRTTHSGTVNNPINSTTCFSPSTTSLCRSTRLVRGAQDPQKVSNLLYNVLHVLLTKNVVLGPRLTEPSTTPPLAEGFSSTRHLGSRREAATGLLSSRRDVRVAPPPAQVSRWFRIPFLSVASRLAPSKMNGTPAGYQSAGVTATGADAGKGKGRAGAKVVGCG